MAERRMFSKQIIDSDDFLDMPLSTQSLYFHLAMRADDEGFINNPKKICRMIGTGQDELKILIAKRFLLTFESGVVVIKHWLVHNMIRKDRVKETLYSEEKSLISVKDNGAYTETSEPLQLLNAAECQPNDNQMSAQVRLGEVRLGKDSIGKCYVTKFALETDERRLTELLISKIKNNNEFAKVPDTEEKIDKWCLHIDRLIRLDGAESQLIANVIDWCQNDSFWKDNILSTKKLREQFPKLYGKYKGNKSPQNNLSTFKESFENGMIADFLKEG